MNAGGAPNTCKSSEKTSSEVSTAADGWVTRGNFPFSEEYSWEIEINTAYVSYERKVASLLPLKDKPADYQLVGGVKAYQGYDG